MAEDWNTYNTDPITKAFPDLTKRKTDPTRKDATLDYAFTNFKDNIQSSEVCYPVESNFNRSDHKLVAYTCMLSRPARFAWETHEYLKITDKGT